MSWYKKSQMQDLQLRERTAPQTFEKTLNVDGLTLNVKYTFDDTYGAQVNSVFAPDQDIIRLMDLAKVSVLDNLCNKDHQAQGGQSPTTGQPI